MDHSHFMRKALALAERGRGRTSPNPMVGALVVDEDGVIVGRGAHEVAGGPAAAGVRTELTGPGANRRVQRQRAEVDASGVGSGTIRADDPLLTPRGAYRARPLTRVVFDRRLRTPPSAHLFSTLDAGPVIIVSTERACAGAPDRMAGLRAARALILSPPADDIGTALLLLTEA